MHRAGRLNRDANGLNRNPSSNKENTTRACWHGDVDFEAVLGWHVFAYLCTLLGCFGDVPQTKSDSGNFQEEDIEP